MPARVSFWTRTSRRPGRHPDADIFLDDVTVSRRHVEFRRTARSFEVVDTGSLNGTYVNHDRVDSVELRSGNEFQIGRTASPLPEPCPRSGQRLISGSCHVATAHADRRGPQVLNIGEVLAQLSDEFPSMTASKSVP